MQKNSNPEEKVIHQGKNVKYFRLKMELTQGDMAKLLSEALNEDQFKHISYKSIPQQYIHNWEKGDILPGEALQLYVYVLKLDPQWITDYIHYEGNGNSFYQDGENNNNFQTIEQVHFTIQNPLDAVLQVQKEANERADKQFTVLCEFVQKGFQEITGNSEKCFKEVSSNNQQLARITDKLIEKLDK